MGYAGRQLNVLRNTTSEKPNADCYTRKMGPVCPPMMIAHYSVQCLFQSFLPSNSSLTL